MSLHNLAQNVQRAGRGDDSVLVHMTPSEVGGLQSLAMAHGGSLTINPHTGLPEAGFLSSLLPMLAGAGLAMIPGVGPLMATGIVGGGTALATGSLQKGLMAGLGAYGGAGIGQALAGSGAAAAGSLAGAGASTVAPAQAAINSQLGQTLGSTAANTAASQAASSVAPTLASAAPASTVGQQLLTPTGLQGSPAASLAASSPVVTPPPPVASPAATTTAMTREAARPLTMADTFSGRTRDLGSGIKTLFGDSEASKALRSDLWKNYRPEIISAGMSVLAGATPGQPKLPDQTYPEWDPNYRAYRTYSPSYRAPGSTAERTYFAADGGLMSLPVENMSAQNQMGRQQGFPMAQQQNNAYTISSSNPISGEVLSSGVDAAVNPYTGENRFATGGTTSGYGTYGGTPKKSKEPEVYTPKYSGYDFTTGQYITNAAPPSYTPYESLPKLSNQRGITTEDMVTQQFQRMYGRAPTADEIAPYVNRSLSERQLSNQLAKAPAFRAKDTWDANELTNYFQSTLGRAPTQDELARFANPNKQFNLNKIYNYAVKQPEFLGQINAAGQKAFDAQQTALTAEQRQKSLVTPTSIASTYQTLFGKPPTMEQLKQYQGANLTPQELKAQLMGTDEYLTKLTKPFVPAIQRDPVTGLASIEGALNPPRQGNPAMNDFYAKMNAQLGQQMNQYVPPAPVGFARGGDTGGISHLGDYSDGGRLLKGPGDGVSDSIPAVIGNRQPARLADGEFVVPARIVSELGNGSTEAGARKLYAMMERVQKARRKTVGKDKVAVNTKSDKLLPA